MSRTSHIDPVIISLPPFCLEGDTARERSSGFLLLNSSGQARRIDKSLPRSGSSRCYYVGGLIAFPKPIQKVRRGETNEELQSLICSVDLVDRDSGCGAEDGEGYILTPDKVRIFYKIVGSGSETLVAVHGGPANSLESIRPDMEPLAKGRRVIYYDQRGNGRSQLIDDGRSSDSKTMSPDLEALRKHFKLEKMSLLETRGAAC